MEINKLKTSCCIVGGGPAGLICGYLLALQGIEVVVLEKHKDFLRDFRGDTIHPSTLQLLHDLGFLEELLKLPHSEIDKFIIEVSDKKYTVADFSSLDTVCKFIALVPQWCFLNLIADKAEKLSNFKLLMQAEAIDFIYYNNEISGIIARYDNDEIQISSKLVISADGRHSVLREKAKLELINIGAPMDVLWLRISRLDNDPKEIMAKMYPGKMFVMLNRKNYWQCAYIIPKGFYEEIKQNSLESFKNNILELTPFFQDRVNELRTWDDIKILSVSVDRLKTWHKSNLLFIGDSAHAMSPVGGVGINLAIQDAIATARILGPKISELKNFKKIFSQIQKRREFPVKVTQKLQVLIQNKIISKALISKDKIDLPIAMRFLLKFKFFRKFIAKKMGIGVRQEKF